jgi:hypothetical protein
MGSPWTFYDAACAGPAASTNPFPTTTTTTTPPARVLPTSMPICGLHTYSGATSAYVYDVSGDFGTPALCGGKCELDNQCYSFAVGSGYCLLFSVPVYVAFLPSPSRDSMRGLSAYQLNFSVRGIHLRAMSRQARGHFTT